MAADPDGSQDIRRLGQGHPEPGPDAGVEDLKADIEQTRSELGDTVSALSDKFDVKARAEQKVADTREAVAQRSHHVVEAAKAKPAIPVGFLVAAAAAVGLVIWLRRR
jgi:ferritin-like metal-binding protein YciE